MNQWWSIRFLFWWNWKISKHTSISSWLYNVSNFVFKQCVMWTAVLWSWRDKFWLDFSNQRFLRIVLGKLPIYQTKSSGYCYVRLISLIIISTTSSWVCFAVNIVSFGKPNISFSNHQLFILSAPKTLDKSLWLWRVKVSSNEIS